MVCGKTSSMWSLLFAGIGVSAVTALLFNWEGNLMSVPYAYKCHGHNRGEFVAVELPM